MGRANGDGRVEDGNPETLKDLLASVKRRESVAIEAYGRSAPYSSTDFATNAYKAGNLFRHYGIRPGSTLAVVAGPKEAEYDPSALGIVDSPEPLLSVFGAVSLGASVDLSPSEPVETRAFVLPARWLDRYTVEPGCSRIAYGGPPDEADVSHFETETWSENPTAPPDPVTAADAALWVDDDTVSHRDVLDVAHDIATTAGIDSGARVALTAPVTEPGALVGGVVAPLLFDSTVYLPGVTDDTSDRIGAQTHAITDGNDSDVPASTTAIDATTVTRRLRER